jgi:hypothetical protein
MKPLVLLLLTFGIAVFAQEQSRHQPIQPGSELWKKVFDPPYTKPTEIPFDSPLRKKLFDLLRPSVQKKAAAENLTKSPLRFEGSLRAFKNWAVFIGKAVDKSGAEIRFDAGSGLDHFMDAIWLRTSEGWKLVDFFAGSAGDYFYEIWFDRFNVPRELLP